MSGTHAETVRYVRESMLPQQDPPLAETGVIKWVRENLFSSLLNAILTVISLYVIYLALSVLIPWVVSPTWGAESLTECRAIFAQLGETTHQACWGVIRDRWNQLAFGFYPSDAYWRPVAALIVFLVAMGPILFDRLPRGMLIFTAISPILMYQLLWGGSIWGPISAALGIVLGYAAFRLLSSINNLLAVVVAILVPILYWVFVAGPLAALLTDILDIGLPFIASKEFGGFTLSVVIGISAILLSLPLGILLALARQSHLPIIKYSAVTFIEVIRGVPLIVWLFTASLLLNYFLPPGTNFDLMLRVIIMVTLFSAAYIAEVIRGGLAALPKGQYEAADALGLDYWKSMRLIILPQALKISIPGIVNTFIGLFKDTTLVVFIGLFDPLGLAGAIRATTAWNGIYWELFIFIGVMFFIFCFSMGRYSLYLEKKLQREHR